MSVATLQPANGVIVSQPGHTETRERVLTAAVENHRGPLRAVIASWIRDQAEVEDILQDVFTEFLDAYDLGVAIDRLGAWLARVARNKILDRFRRQKTRKANHQELNTRLNEQSPASRPDEEWLRGWLREELAEALMSLPLEQRDVFIQHELEGKSFEEIAAATGVNINTLLARKRYAIKYLREYLKEVYDELE